MKIFIKDATNEADIKFDVDSEDISIWQGSDLVMLHNAKMARKAIKAIKKSAKHLGWDLK